MLIYVHMQCPKHIQLHNTIHAQLAGVESVHVRPMCKNNMNQPHCIERSLEHLVVLNQVIQNVISENSTSSGRFTTLSIIINKTVLDTCELVNLLIIIHQLSLKLLIIHNLYFCYLQVNKKN